MDQDAAAARAAKSRKRPLSRASTTSIHSATPQPTLDQPTFAETSAMYGGQWMPSDHHGHPKDMGTAPQMSPEALILQAASHMQSGNHDFQMDGSMSAAMDHHLAYQHHHHTMARHPLPAEQQYGANASFVETDSQMLDRDENEDGDSITGASAAGRLGSARSSANNELEMRHLFNANRRRSLQDVARELHGNERGPNSERTRQVFAMLWINSVCSKGKGSVPRGRVYANYASRCATERITVLNPASFGKLVRVLFPGLKTRRLGVRGESKYHYVNFSLVEDQPDVKEPQPEPSKPLTETKDPSQNLSASPSRPTDAAQGVLPSPRAATQDRADTVPLKSLSASHSVYNHPDLGNLDGITSTSDKTHLELAFPSLEGDAFEQSAPIALPPIQAYLPRGTDADAAKSLSALYRSHCTSLVECIRYCREKTFFHLYTSFQGTLTMPVQKLFGHSAVAPWIEGCDIALYQRMMMIVSGLTLQVLPKPVLDTLRNIAEKLVSHIRDSFQGQPAHVIKAKESPAVIFVGLLDRALRVNLTAHAAANMLANPANRDQMYLDWITMIRARKMAECVPTRAMDDVVNLLVNEMRDLLDPASVPWEVECLTIYGDVVTKSGRQTEADSAGGTTGQNVLDRWVSFLQNLPANFPYSSHGDIVWCVERIGTAVMRDLTLAQGKSFGSWWVTKTWIDEMICFLAEQGGFMKQKAKAPFADQETQPPPRSQPQLQPSTETTSRQGSRYRSGSEDLRLGHSTDSQPGRAPFPPPSNNNNNNNNNTHTMTNTITIHSHSTQQQTLGTDSHDDSGIGIRTPEEDFPIDKFTFSGPDTQAMLSETELVAGANC